MGRCKHSEGAGESPGARAVGGGGCHVAGAWLRGGAGVDLNPLGGGVTQPRTPSDGGTAGGTQPHTSVLGPVLGDPACTPSFGGGRAFTPRVGGGTQPHTPEC